MSAECGIFFGKFCKRFTEFALACLGLRLDRQFNNRFREFHAFQNNRMILVTDGITCSGELESDRRSYVAAVDLGKFRSLIRMHLQDTSDTLLLVLRRIHDVRAGFAGAGIDSEISKPSDERIRYDLEYKCRERRVV